MVLLQDAKTGLWDEEAEVLSKRPSGSYKLKLSNGREALRGRAHLRPLSAASNATLASGNLRSMLKSKRTNDENPGKKRKLTFFGHHGEIFQSFRCQERAKASASTLIANLSRPNAKANMVNCHLNGLIHGLNLWNYCEDEDSNGSGIAAQGVDEERGGFHKPDKSKQEKPRPPVRFTDPPAKA